MTCGSGAHKPIGARPGRPTAFAGEWGGASITRRSPPRSWRSRSAPVWSSHLAGANPSTNGAVYPPPWLQRPSRSRGTATRARSSTSSGLHASPRHRKGIAEGLITATVASASRVPGAPSLDLQRRALLRWAFNTSARRGLPIDRGRLPEEFVETLRWLDNNTPTLDEFAGPRFCDPCSTRSPSDSTGHRPPRRPSPASGPRVYSALAYAVELELLATHPMDRIHSPRAQHTDVVDRRVVVNPQQAASLLQAVRTIHPSLEAYFACLYYAGLRPAEARHLRESNFRLPGSRMGHSAPRGLHADGRRRVDRLRQERRGPTAQTPDSQGHPRGTSQPGARRDPAPTPRPFPLGPDGRLFVTRTGRAGTPLAGPYATPQSMGIVYRVWDQARRERPQPEGCTDLLWPDAPTTFGTPRSRCGSTPGCPPPRSPSGPVTASTSCYAFTPSASTGRTRPPSNGSRPRSSRRQPEPAAECPELLRVFCADCRRQPRTAGDGRTDRRAPTWRFRRSEALLRWWWQVKDSNLRSFRDGFTVRSHWPLGQPAVTRMEG